MVVEIWGREYLLNDHDCDNNYGGGRALTVSVPFHALTWRQDIIYCSDTESPSREPIGRNTLFRALGLGV